MQQVKRKFPVLLAIALLFGFFIPIAVGAAVNDNFVNATPIGDLPYVDRVDSSAASIESGEPQSCIYTDKTVWYSFTAMTDAVVLANLSGSSVAETVLSVYQANGTELSDLLFLACAAYTGTQTTFAVQAGMTYYLQAGSYSSGGDLVLALESVPPPSNDDFSAALPISLPFNGPMDSSGATLQSGELSQIPPNCAGDGLQGTVWAAFTSTMNGPVSVSVSAPFSAWLAVYTGSSLTNLTGLGCQNYPGTVTFQAFEGVTYYIQLGSLYGPGGPMQVTLDVASAPVANFFFSPSTPSVYDSIQFYDNSYDPGGSGFQPPSWDFGDGAFATDYYPLHRYAKDNDYTVNLTVTTLDGRSASTSQLVSVRSHDVAIVKFSAAKSAKAGQTRQLSVGVSRASPDPATTKAAMITQ